MKHYLRNHAADARGGRPLRRQILGACAAGGWLLLLGLLGMSCSDSTGPGEVGPPRIGFSPDVDSLVLDLQSQRLFTVELDNAPGARIRICRGDSLLSEERSYLYEAARIGRDSLCATVSLGDSTVSKTWRIEVVLGAAGLTPPVLGLALAHGSTPGSILLTWLKPAEAITPRPLERYLVGVSYTEMTGVADWQQAVVIDAVADLPQQHRYQRQYDDGDTPAVIPGQEVYVAVRVEDEAGVLSDLGPVLSLKVSSPYWLRGVVRDDALAPLPGVLVDYGCDTCKTLTDGVGAFELGPFRAYVDSFVLNVRDDSLDEPGLGAFYDFRTDTLGADTPQPLEVRLINVYGLEDVCSGVYDGGDFLTYLRKTTRTDKTTNDRPNRDLLKWESYPLAVHVEEAWNDDETFPMHESAATAIAYWNGRMGGDYLVAVADSAAAQILIRFTAQGLGENLLGLATLLQPGNGTFAINEAIPEIVRILVNPGASNEERTQEIVLHELGHALLLGEHSDCYSPAEVRHVMLMSPFHIIEDRYPDWPISIDEMRAVRAIRNLPQGVDMSHYFRD